MNINEYIAENNRHNGDLVILDSVGTALDKISGDTYPLMADSTFGIDEPMNLMDMDFEADSYEWFESLSDTDSVTVNEVLCNLKYNNLYTIPGCATPGTNN